MAAEIPTALLAGILIKVGLDIIDWSFLLRAHRLSIKTAALMYSVLLMTALGLDLGGAGRNVCRKSADGGCDHPDAITRYG